MQVHICDKSFEQNVVIKKPDRVFRPAWLPKENKETWSLYKHDNYICDVKYCPFCGKKLK